MDVPPRDSHGKGKTQLLPLLGDLGPVAFEVESLWVLATHALVPSAVKDVIFLTVFCCYSSLSCVTLSLCLRSCRSIDALSYLQHLQNLS